MTLRIGYQRGVRKEQRSYRLVHDRRAADRHHRVAGRVAVCVACMVLAVY